MLVFFLANFHRVFFDRLMGKKTLENDLWLIGRRWPLFVLISWLEAMLCDRSKEEKLSRNTVQFWC